MKSNTGKKPVNINFKVRERKGHLVAIERLLAEVLEDFGRANFKFCNDSDYGGTVATIRHRQLDLAFAHVAYLTESAVREIEETEK